MTVTSPQLNSANPPARSARVAVVQAATRLSDPQAAIDLVAEWTRRASSQGAELVVFPESFVGGYPKGSDFGAVVGQRTAAGREQYRSFVAGAIAVPGPETDRLSEIAAESHILLVVGVIELGSDTLYCSILTFDADGALLGKRRKLMGVASERLLFGWGDGSTLDVHETSLGRIGTLMCWENLMPAARLAMYGQGVELYCAPTAVGGDVDVATARHIAREGRCFVLAANAVMDQADFPTDYAPLRGPDDSVVVSHGGSVITGPNGDIIAGPIWDEEALLVADVDLDDIIRWKYDFDVVGHFSRPDIFRLHVDRTRREPTRDITERRTEV